MVKLKEEKMVKLKDVTKLIRSKNAGPFQLTFDIFFDGPGNYYKVKDSGVINEELIAQLYKAQVGDVLLTYCDNIVAIKVTIPRPAISGSSSDTDIYGGQQYAPLMEVEVPGE